MRIVVGYVPIESDLGVPLLSQNRQFQWFSKPTYVYPMVPASAATLLASKGHEVLWLDGIAEGLSQEKFDERFAAFKPDLFLLETKTPVVKATWRKVDHLKQLVPGCTIVLCGDHVTAFPEETLRACKADFVLAGGDYDFSVAALVECLDRSIGPSVHRSIGPTDRPAARETERPKDLPPGFYWRTFDGTIESSGPFCNKDHKLEALPEIDRELTKWELYSRENGNFRRTTGTCAIHQRQLTVAIKRARQIALLPYVAD